VLDKVRQSKRKTCAHCWALPPGSKSSKKTLSVEHHVQGVSWKCGLRSFGILCKNSFETELCWLLLRCLQARPHLRKHVGNIMRQWRFGASQCKESYCEFIKSDLPKMNFHPGVKVFLLPQAVCASLIDDFSKNHCYIQACLPLQSHTYLQATATAE